MKRKILYTILCLGILTTVGCGKAPALKNGEEIAASIDEFKITSNDLYDELKVKGGSSVMVDMIDSFIANKEIKTTDDVTKAAQAQLEQLKDQYKQYGYDFNEALTQSGMKNEKELLNSLVLDQKKKMVLEKYLTTKITDEEINKYYNENITGEITAKHILIKPKTTEKMTEEQTKKAEEEALTKAQNIIKKLQNGEKFETLAKKYSADEATANEGGLFSNFTKKDVVPEFWNGAVNLKNGDYTTTPVKSTYGYHIILKIKQNELPKLEKVKQDIINDLVTEKLTNDKTIQTTAWAEIRKNYNLKINDSSLKKGYKQIITPVPPKEEEQAPATQ
ncbi:MAG: peptidylprolyl isomerase [Bacilli bacterium]